MRILSYLMNYSTPGMAHIQIIEAGLT